MPITRSTPTISTTKPFDADVRCDTCRSSIDDGSTLTWNPLAGAIECQPCAEVERRSARIVVATVARSRTSVDEPITHVTAAEPHCTEGHLFDASSAMADAAASDVDEVCSDEDNTAEVDLDQIEVHAVSPEKDQGLPSGESEWAVITPAPAAKAGAFAPPIGLRPVPIPAPPVASGVSDPSPELEAVLEAVAETRRHEPIAAPVVSPDDALVSAPSVTAVTLTARRIPRSRTTIGRIVVAPSGVFVVEDCVDSGEVAIATKRRSESVRVGGVDQSKTLKKIRLAHRAASGLLHVVGADQVSTRSVLLVSGGGATETTSDGIEMFSASEFEAEVAKPGGLDASMVRSLAEQLVQRFPMA